MQVFLNKLAINVQQWKQSVEKADKKEKVCVRFTFDVRSEDSHRVTTELYRNDFLVKVPEKNLEFRATIRQYSTSITDLSKGGEIAVFKLELIEK